MTPLGWFAALLAYVLGGLTVIAACRYHHRARRRPVAKHRADDSLGFIRRHIVAIALAGVLLDVVVTASVAVLYTDVRQLEHCQGGYLSGSARLATARDDALQKLLDDVSSQTGRARFLTDLKAEQAAYRQLAAFRASQAPKEACQ